MFVNESDVETMNENKLSHSERFTIRDKSGNAESLLWLTV